MPVKEAKLLAEEHLGRVGMADRMEEIYQNEVLRKSIGKQALATYEEIYNPRKVAAKYHDIYESC